MNKITRSVSIGALLDKIDVTPPEKTIENASFKQNVQKSFRGWARTNHPDKGGDLETFQIISDANDKFRNGELRPSPKTLTKWNLEKETSVKRTETPFSANPNTYSGFSHGASTPDPKTQKEKTANTKQEEATKAVNRGENIQVVAKRFGITDPVALAHLESSATFRPGRKAVESGEHPESVAQRMGIKDPGNFVQLFEIAAIRAIDHGENIHTVAQRYGIVLAKVIANLEKHATHGPARLAVQCGEHPQVAAQRLGITNPDYVTYLMAVAQQPSWHR